MRAKQTADDGLDDIWDDSNAMPFKSGGASRKPAGTSGTAGSSPGAAGGAPNMTQGSPDIPSD